MNKNGWSMLIFLVLILGIRFYLYIYSPSTFKNGDIIRISSKVYSEPIRYETAQYLKLEGLKIYLPLYPEISYGDRIVVEGKVNQDKLEKPKLIKVSESDGYIYKFRKKLLNFYNTSLPTPHSALIAGMVIGSKSGIPNDFWEALKKSGTAHVVVASGMNIALIAGFLLSFFTLFFKRGKALLLTLIGIWMYAVLSGFDAPIVRAALMGSIGFSAQEFGRISQTIRTLVITGLIMILVKPEWAIDVGFLLSFFATLSIVLFQKKILKFLKSVPSIVREDFATTLAAQIGVAPILYFAFGQLNIFSPIINIIILWTVPPITIIGMLGGVAGLAVPTLGRLILFLVYPLTSWFISTVTLFS